MGSPRRVHAAVLGVALAVLLAGCRHGSAKLAGHWRGLRAEGVTVDLQDAANAFAGKMQLDVSGDVITVTTATDKQSGHYKMITEEKTKVVIVTDKDGPNDQQTFTFSDAKTMRWTVSTGKAIVFVKE